MVRKDSAVEVFLNHRAGLGLPGNDFYELPRIVALGFLTLLDESEA